MEDVTNEATPAGNPLVAGTITTADLVDTVEAGVMHLFAKAEVAGKALLGQIVRITVAEAHDLIEGGKMRPASPAEVEAAGSAIVNLV